MRVERLNRKQICINIKILLIRERMFSNLLKNNNLIIYLGLYMIFLNLFVTPANAEIYSKDGTYDWRYSIEQ